MNLPVRLRLRTLLILIAAQAAPGSAGAQSERPAGFQPDAVAFLGGTVISAPGVVVKNATLVIRRGVITAIGQNVEPPADAEKIDASGLFLYPGFIDAGVSELVDPEVKPPLITGRTHDFAKQALAATPADLRHGLTPEFRSAGALKWKDDALDAFRQQGLVIAHATPTGRIASGQSAIVALSGHPVRESVVKETFGQSLQLVALGGQTYPSTLMGTTAHLRQAFLDAGRDALHRELFARNAAGLPRPPVDAGWVALDEVGKRRMPAIFAVTTRDDIHRALVFAAEHNLRPILWGARDAAQAIDRIVESGCPVLLSLDLGAEPKVEPPAPGDALKPDRRDPAAVQEFRRSEWRRQAETAALLKTRGVPFAFSSRGLKNRGEFLKTVRSLISAGLSPEAALAALTTEPATLFGLSDRAGTLAVGRPALLTALNGPLEHEKALVRYTLIDDRRFEYHKDAKPVAAESTPHASDPAKPASIAGVWALDIAGAEGKTAAQLTLAQDGAKLSGTLTSDRGNGRLLSGSVQKTTVEFVVGIGAGDRNVELKFTGQFDSGALRGELKPAFGAATTWTATRVMDPAAQKPNPIQISLDPSEPKESSGPAEAEIPVAPNSARSTPAVAEKPLPIDPNEPVELPSDRTRRPLQTGGDLLVKNVNVLTGTGQTLMGVCIRVRNGKFAAIGPDLPAEPGLRVIDAGGRWAMPGIIDTHSHIMITQGINEATQSIVCEVRIKDVLNTSDVSEYRALAGGVTAARVFHGSANVIGGQDAVIKLKHGCTASEHLVREAPQGVKFALGENVKFQTNRFPNTRMGVEATLNRAFLEAIDYRRQWQEHEKAVRAAAREEAALKQGETERSGDGKTDGKADPTLRPSDSPSPPRLLPPRRDLRLEALADIVDHRKFIHSHCYRSDEILMLLDVAKSINVRVWSLQHVLEGYKVAPEIVAHGASCSTFADWWAYKVEAFDATPFNAALLSEAGANVVIKSDDWELIRHLYQEAAKPLRYGNLPPEKALATITLNPARELGIADRMGSIEVGKDADFAIHSGHPFNVFSRCDLTFIEGELYFSRSDAPTAMRPEAAVASARPADWTPIAADARKPVIDPSPAANGKYAIVGATLHPVDAAEIEQGTLLIAEGKIAAIGRDLPIPDDARRIDASGLHLYPGLIDAGTTVGLTEIGKVRETHDFAEAGLFQPDLRAGIALNPDSELLPVTRIGGVTTVLLRPAGGIVCGQASLAQLSGWTAPEMVLDYSAGLQINCPSGDDAAKRHQQLADFFRDARLYQQALGKGDGGTEGTGDGGKKTGGADTLRALGSLPVADPRFEAMLPILRGEKPVFFEANSRREIVEALQFAEKEKVKLILTGGTDAWKVADELKKRDIPVIVGPVMRAPMADHDPHDAPYANAGRLHAAGVRFCIRSNNASNSRNVPFEAGMAVAFGLPESAGLRAVTLSSAEILGISSQFGSLSPGKRATLQLTDGSPLQPATQIKAVFIDGRPIPLESRQTKFYERYRQRLHEWQKAQAPKTTVTGKAAE